MSVDTFLSFSDPYVVAFVETMYTVVESEGRVEVCVNLTRPEIDILNETVQVDVFHYDSSVYIPPNSVLASESPLFGCCLLIYTTFPSVAPDIINIFTRMYPMLPMTDYEEQTIAINLIMGTKITALRRRICYNQSIYDDVRLEVSEYAGLGLVADDTLSTVITTVEPMYNESAILIIDDDSKSHIDIITTTLCIFGGGAHQNSRILCQCPSARLCMHACMHEMNFYLPYAIFPCYACT